MQLGMHPSIGLQIRQTTYAGLSDTGISSDSAEHQRVQFWSYLHINKGIPNNKFLIFLAENYNANAITCSSKHHKSFRSEVFLFMAW